MDDDPSSCLYGINTSTWATNKIIDFTYDGFGVPFGLTCDNTYVYYIERGTTSKVFKIHKTTGAKSDAVSSFYNPAWTSANRNGLAFDNGDFWSSAFDAKTGKFNSSGTTITYLNIAASGGGGIEFAKGYLWMGSSNYLNKYDPSDGTLLASYQISVPGISVNYVHDIAYDPTNDRFWIRVRYISGTFRFRIVEFQIE